ncbi:family 43 glycosylhydrolase [Salinifilum aidingensis]
MTPAAPGPARTGRRALLGVLAAAPLLAGGRGARAGAEGSAVPEEVSAGEYRRVYDPSAGEDRPWYINDHCFVRGRDGLWHLFGITHPEPAEPMDERTFAHATAPHPLGPWTKRAPALTADPDYFGETVLWAPHVVEHRGLYWMFYCGGGHDRTRFAISAAVSADLWRWRRLPTGPLFRDGYDARDPALVRRGGRWLLFYTATSEPAGGNHVVACRTSADLLRWSERFVVFRDEERGTWGGPTESPFVLERGGSWYLFIGPRGGYVGTDVFAGVDPLHFDLSQRVGHVPSHAAEVLRAGGRWWVSSAGWGQGGVHLAPLVFGGS